MTKKNYTITKYDCGNDYFVEVSDNELTGWKDFYIYKDGYSVKMFMFGIAVAEEDVENMIETNFDAYVTIYENEYL